MSKTLPQYAADFPVAAEAEIASCIEEAAEVIYVEMQGGALVVAVDAMQLIVTRFSSGDRSVSAADAMRAAREIRNLMHEKAALKRQCRAEAIEKLGLRPRPPVDGTRPQPAPAKPAPEARPESEDIVKTPEPARGPLGDWLKVDVRQTEIPTDTTAART